MKELAPFLYKSYVHLRIRQLVTSFSKLFEQSDFYWILQRWYINKIH